MKKPFVWLLMMTKRQLKKISFYIIMLLPALTCLSINHIAKNFTVTVKIAVLNEDGSEISDRLMERLTKHKGLIAFEECESRGELETEVRKSRVIGAYIIREDFSEILESGLESEIIESVTTPAGSIFSAAADEIFFSYVMAELSYEDLVRDTLDTGYFKALDEEEIRSELREYYDTYFSGTDTFGLVYDEEIDEEKLENINLGSYVYDYISPIALGMSGLFIFIAALGGCLNYYTDRDNGSFCFMRRPMREFMALVEILIPALPVAAFSAVMLYFGGFELNPSRLLRYILIVAAYCYALHLIIRRREVYISLIPLLVLMSLVFCPVFVNIASFVPELEFVGQFLPLWYLL